MVLPIRRVYSFESDKYQWLTSDMITKVKTPLYATLSVFCLPVFVCQSACQCLCAGVSASVFCQSACQCLCARVLASVCVPECLPVFVCKRQGVQGGATPLARYA